MSSYFTTVWQDIISIGVRPFGFWMLYELAYFFANNFNFPPPANYSYPPKLAGISNDSSSVTPTSLEIFSYIL